MKIAIAVLVIVLVSFMETNAQTIVPDTSGTTIFDKVMFKKTGYTCLEYLKKINRDSYKRSRLPANVITAQYTEDFPEVLINDDYLFNYNIEELKKFKKIKEYSYKIDPVIPRNGENLLIKQLKFKAK